LAGVASCLLRSRDTQLEAEDKYRRGCTIVCTMIVTGFVLLVHFTSFRTVCGCVLMQGNIRKCAWEKSNVRWYVEIIATNDIFESVSQYLFCISRSNLSINYSKKVNLSVCLTN
jgi:hypothetical protein